jgi:hypothetical protein
MQLYTRVPACAGLIVSPLDLQVRSSRGTVGAKGNRADGDSSNVRAEVESNIEVLAWIRSHVRKLEIENAFLVPVVRLVNQCTLE